MKKSVLTLSILISILSVFFFVDSTFASDEDFFVETKTEISYTTGKDYVTVSTEYIRTVKNSDF